MRTIIGVVIAAFALTTIAPAQQPTPGEKQIAGVTAQMLPDPPQSATTPAVNVSGPTFDQTIQWMAETAPRNPDDVDWVTPLTAYILPGSTCSKTGFAIFGGSDGKGVAWLSVNLGGVDSRGVFAFGNKVLFGGAVVQIPAARAEDFLKGKQLNHKIGTFDQFSFSSAEYAARFASALRHAAEVCGGKAPPPPAGQPF